MNKKEKLKNKIFRLIAQYRKITIDEPNLCGVEDYTVICLRDFRIIGSTADRKYRGEISRVYDYEEF